ncbi:hypothetical protein AAVH_17943 [Aphelenchoides avenae]|nr:hypothetical protein AAVH_17943 [Aphelenchus avenae]
MASLSLANKRFARIVTRNRDHLPLCDFFSLMVDCDWPLCRLKWVEHAMFREQSTDWEEYYVALRMLEELTPPSFIRNLTIRNLNPDERPLTMPTVVRIDVLDIGTAGRLAFAWGTPDGRFAWDALPNVTHCKLVRWTTTCDRPEVWPAFIDGCIQRNVRELTIDETTTTSDPIVPTETRVPLDHLFRFLFDDRNPHKGRKITVNLVNVASFLERLFEVHQTSQLSCNVHICVRSTGQVNVAGLLDAYEYGGPGIQAVAGFEKTAPSVYICRGDVQLTILTKEGLEVKRGLTAQDTNFFAL